MPNQPKRNKRRLKKTITIQSNQSKSSSVFFNKCQNYSPILVVIISIFIYIQFFITPLYYEGLTINDQIPRGHTKLITAALKGNHVEVKRLLTVWYISINLPCTFGGLTPLYAASAKPNNYKIVETLLQFPGIDVNRGNVNDGSTALHIACEQGHILTTRKLMEMGSLLTPAININKIRFVDGATPLMMACQNGKVEIVLELMKYKSLDISIASNDGTTALLSACLDGHTNIVALLLDKFKSDNDDGVVDPKFLNYRSGGYTPLFIAVSNGHLKTVEYLLTIEGVDINQGRPGKPGVGRWSPLDDARRKNYTKIEKLLLDAGATTFRKETVKALEDHHEALLEEKKQLKKELADLRSKIKLKKELADLKLKIKTLASANGDEAHAGE